MNASPTSHPPQGLSTPETPAGRVVQIHNERGQSEFEKRTQRVTSSVTASFENAIRVLHSLADFYVAAADAEQPAVFSQFARRTLAVNPEVQSLSWNPRITNSGRLEFSQLEQLLMNLAVNARDAMPRGGTLTIGTTHVQVDTDVKGVPQSVAPGKYVKLTISDTGIGMDAHIKSHLFEPFFTTKPRGEGTGLGLATVYGIVQQNGGYIQVSSEPGEGTTFTVLLPFAEEGAVPEQTITESDTSRRGTETVLVVEDEVAVRELIAKILKRHGYAVVSAGSLREALAEIRSRHARIDLLLTDVVMPVESGPTIAERLRRYFPNVSVLYMSGYTDTALGPYGVLEPGIALLHKPFPSGELLSTVREILDTHGSSGLSTS